MGGCAQELIENTRARKAMRARTSTEQAQQAQQDPAQVESVLPPASEHFSSTWQGPPPAAVQAANQHGQSWQPQHEEQVQWHPG